MALVVAPLTTAVMVSAPDSLSGAASGVNNTASRLAGLFAITIIGAVASVAYLGELKANGIPLDDLRFGVLPSAGRADHAVFERPFSAPTKSRFRLPVSGVFGRYYRFCPCSGPPGAPPNNPTQ